MAWAPRSGGPQPTAAGGRPSAPAAGLDPSLLSQFTATLASRVGQFAAPLIGSFTQLGAAFPGDVGPLAAALESLLAQFAAAVPRDFSPLAAAVAGDLG